MTLSFEEALEETSKLLQELHTGVLPANALEARVDRIVSTPPGARGFLVNFLTSDLPLADAVPEEILSALRNAPDLVCDLLAKNLVMSITMALTHERNGDLSGMQGSLRVQRRTVQIIRCLKSESMKQRLEEMWGSVTRGSGAYADFLSRWHYDEEQLEKAQEAIKPLRGVDG